MGNDQDQDQDKDKDKDKKPDPPPESKDRKALARDKAKRLHKFLGGYKPGDIIGPQELGGMKQISKEIEDDLDDDSVATAGDGGGLFDFGKPVK